MDWQLETTVSDEQVKFYKENGYITFGRIFTKAEVGYTPRLCGRDDCEFAGRQTS